VNLTAASVNGTNLLSKLQAAHDSVQSSLMWDCGLVWPFVMCDGSNHGWLQSMCSIPTRALEGRLSIVAGDMAVPHAAGGLFIVYSVFVNRYRRLNRWNVQ